MRSEPRVGVRKKSGPTFPWVLMLLFLVSVYFFWIFPNREAAPPVEIEWQASPAEPRR